jgi:hypothetical protein
MAECVQLLELLYQRLKRHGLSSKVVGADKTPGKDAGSQAQASAQRATRERAGPEEFLKSYRGYLQAIAYVAYDSFFLQPGRGMLEVGCWAHARRHVFQHWKRSVADANDFADDYEALSRQEVGARAWTHRRGTCGGWSANKVRVQPCKNCTRI